MKKRARVASLGLIAGAVPAAAFAAVAVGDKIGVSDEEIRSALEAEGYILEEIEREDGEIEAEVVLNGTEFEITIDPENTNYADTEPTWAPDSQTVVFVSNRKRPGEDFPAGSISAVIRPFASRSKRIFLP